MAMYRIKKDDSCPDDQLDKLKTYLVDEYWRETDPSFARDLDFEEIEELNRKAEEEEAWQKEHPEAAPDESPFRSPWVKAIIALFVVVAITLWLSVSMVGNYFDWGILSNSSRLVKDESLAALQEAVVVIEGSGGNGTGFNIAADGLIVTNRHVVEDSKIITIRFGGENSATFTTKEWIDIPEVDMALIDIAGEDLPVVELNNEYPSAGEEIIFIGNPLGYDWTISEGAVISMVAIDNVPLIYFSGPVQPGSSGSPVFNDQSQVIGVIFAKLTDKDDAGLAIPISYLTNFLEESYEH